MFEAGVVTSSLYYGYDVPVYFALGLATSWYVIDGISLAFLAMFVYGILCSAILNGLLYRASGRRLVVWLAIFINLINIEQSFLNSINYAYKMFLIALLLILVEYFVLIAIKRNDHIPLKEIE